MSTNSNATITWICGSYTGNGTTQTISGLGFQPDAVIIKSSGAATAFIKTSTMASTASRGFSSTSGVSTNAITGFIATGFTVGANAAVNTNTTTYFFYAFKSSNIVKVGTYTGNGAANRNIVATASANTKFVIIIPETTYGGSVWYSHNNTASGYSYDEGASKSSNWTSSPSFTVPTTGFCTFSGSAPKTNENTIVYHYIGFVESASECEVNAYTGDGVNGRAITGLSFKPNFILSTGGDIPIIIRNSQLTGDASQYFSATANASNQIESFTASGFTVGNSINVNNSGFNQTYVVLGGANGGILPIELLNFDTQLLMNRTVLITWTTASEKNNEFFTIERSDNLTDFVAIGEIKGAGNSDSQLNYEFTDEKTITNPTVYYRLRQTDLDGKSKTSNIKALFLNEIQNDMELEIVQNPIMNDQLIYDLSMPTDATMNVQIIGNNGNTVFTQNDYYKHGNGPYSLGISSLKSGMYILSITDLETGIKKNIRFIVND